MFRRQWLTPMARPVRAIAIENTIVVEIDKDPNGTQSEIALIRNPVGVFVEHNAT